MDPTIEEIIPNWTTRPYPRTDPRYHALQGQYCRLEILDSKTDDAIIQQLFEVFKPNEEIHYKYLKYGPFNTADEFRQFVHGKEQPINNTVLYTVFVNDKAVGFLSYLRIKPENGTIEIGHLNFSQQLTRTRPATEAVFLLLQHAFDTLGYRRVEWKCNALNQKSRNAAMRFGFKYDGTWVKAEVAKGRSRDNSWYSIIDDEWIEVKKEYQRWLNPENFDQNEQQLSKLNGSEVNPRQLKIVEVRSE